MELLHRLSRRSAIVIASMQGYITIGLLWYYNVVNSPVWSSVDCAVTVINCNCNQVDQLFSLFPILWLIIYLLSEYLFIIHDLILCQKWI